MQPHDIEVQEHHKRLHETLMTVIHTGGGTSAQRSMAGAAVEEFFEMIESGLPRAERQCCVLDCWDTLADMAPWIKTELPDALEQLRQAAAQNR